MSFQKLNILYVITSLRSGGAERLVVDLSINLKKRGHDVTVYVLDGTDTPFKQELIIANIPVYEAGKGYLQMRNPLNFFKLKKLIDNKGFDVVHTHNTMAQFLGAISIINRKPKLITTEHNTFNIRRKWFGFRIVDKYVYNRYDKIICVGESVKSELLKYLEENMSERYPVIYNGVDLTGLQPLAYKCGNKKKFIISMVSAFRKQKDHETIIRSVSLLPENFEIWLAGEGRTKEKYKKLVSSLGLDDRIKFLGNVEKVEEIISKSDILVLSTHYEGMPFSILEGMRAGKPYIASDVGGVREIVAGYGLLFTHKDQQDLASKIKMVYENKDLYNELSALSLRRVQDFDIEKTVWQHEHLYLSILNSR